MNSKTCSKCGTENPLSKFLKHPQYRTGYGGVCRSCRNELYNKKRQANPEKYRRLDREAKQRSLAKGNCETCSKKRLSHSAKYCEIHYFANVAFRVLKTAKIDMAKRLQEKMDAQNWECPYTGTKLVLGLNCHLDHRLPIVRFPEFQRELWNLEWVSSEVNQAKADKTPSEFLILCHKAIRNL